MQSPLKNDNIKKYYNIALPQYSFFDVQLVENSEPSKETIDLTAKVKSNMDLDFYTSIKFHPSEESFVRKQEKASGEVMIA